ncbi:hypothetical protein RCL1_001073 [Eukaryota sp. TZLM3-RCL]
MTESSKTDNKSQPKSSTVSRKPSDPKNVVHENEIWRERIRSEAASIEYFNDVYKPVLPLYRSRNNCKFDSTQRTITPDLIATGQFPPAPIDSLANSMKRSGKFSASVAKRLQTLSPAEKMTFPVLSSMDYGWEKQSLESFNTCAVSKVSLDDASEKCKLFEQLKSNYSK